MWNSKKYSEAVRYIAREVKHINNKSVGTKESVYLILSGIFGYSTDAVKGWTRPTSSGPDNKDIIPEIEKLLQLSPGTLYQNDELTEVPEETPDSANTNYNITDFNKTAIFTVYQLMKDYLSSDHVEDEETFLDLVYTIETYRVAIPDELYNKVSAFLNDRLSQITFNPRETFSACHSEEIGHFDKNGAFVINEGKEQIFCLNFLMVIENFNQELDEFALKEMHPYLI